MVPDDARPRPATHFRLELVEDEALLYSATSERVIYLSSTAWMVWQLCDGERSVRQIIDLLCEAYPDARERVENDVRVAIRSLVDHQGLQLA